MKIPSLVLGLVFASCLRLFAAEGSWSVGVDTSVDASAGLRGGASRGESLHGLALGHFQWEQSKQGAGPVRFQTYASLLALAGHGPTERVLGDFLTVSNSEGYPSTRLYSWWAEASFGDASLRAGALLADEEFSGTTAGGNFLNAAFGWPAFISANTVNTGPAFFVAAPGLRFDYRFNDTTLVRTGIYDGDTFDSALGDPQVNRHGWHYHLGGAQGWFLIGELAVTPTGAAHRFKLGAWLHTADFASVGPVPRSHHGNFGAYAALEQTLAGKSGEAGNVEAYARLGLAPADRSPIAWALDTGLAWTGPVSSRPGDVVCLGLAHGSFSSRYTAQARALAPRDPAPDAETVVELAYRFALSPRFSLQPDVQFIRHPGGSSAQRDAVAALLRFAARY